jgi:hypothetical protein
MKFVPGRDWVIGFRIRHENMIGTWVGLRYYLARKFLVKRFDIRGDS